MTFNRDLALRLATTILGLGIAAGLVFLNIPQNGPIGQFYVLTGLALLGMLLPILAQWQPESTPLAYLAGLLAAVGWNGLLLTIYYLPNHVGALWLFFTLLSLALTGTAIPLHQLFNQRSNEPVAPPILLRRSIWVAIWGILSCWLAIRGSLNLVLLGLLAISCGTIEWLWELRAKVAWQPIDEAQSE
jgi:predicted ABC-type sugar transport system permease subunit